MRAAQSRLEKLRELRDKVDAAIVDEQIREANLEQETAIREWARMLGYDLPGWKRIPPHVHRAYTFAQLVALTEAVENG